MIHQKLKKSILIYSVVIIAPFTYADTEHAIEELKKGNYQAAFNELKPLAEQGDVKAQIYLGGMYDRGNGMTQDFKSAAKWYLKAANQGNDEAQYSLASMYQAGEGVPKDLNKAKEWYLKAANQGLAKAQLGLAALLLLGDGDETVAAGWALKAANQGLPEAQETLGKLYASGIGVPKDISKAKYWLAKAATAKANNTTSIPNYISLNPQPAPTLSAEEIRFTELTQKAKVLWKDLNGFRYNRVFHTYAFWSGAEPGAGWNNRYNALFEECSNYRDLLPDEIQSEYSLCGHIKFMWAVAVDWANNKGNNTPDTVDMISRIEKSLKNNGKIFSTNE